MNGITVCHNCKKRHVGCHAACEDYSVEKAKIEAEKSLRNDAKVAKSAVDDVLYKPKRSRKR